MSRFTDPTVIARSFARRDAWDDRRDEALNKAITDRSLVAAALYNLLTAVQLESSLGATPQLLQAEAEAVRALELVGGPLAP